MPTPAVVAPVVDTSGDHIRDGSLGAAVAAISGEVADLVSPCVKSQAGEMPPSSQFVGTGQDGATSASAGLGSQVEAMSGDQIQDGNRGAAVAAIGGDGADLVSPVVGSQAEEMLPPSQFVSTGHDTHEIVGATSASAGLGSQVDAMPSSQLSCVGQVVRAASGKEAVGSQDEEMPTSEFVSTGQDLLGIVDATQVDAVPPTQLTLVKGGSALVTEGVGSQTQEMPTSQLSRAGQAIRGIVSAAAGDDGRSQVGQVSTGQDIPGNTGAAPVSTGVHASSVSDGVGSQVGMLPIAALVSAGQDIRGIAGAAPVGAGAAVEVEAGQSSQLHSESQDVPAAQPSRDSRDGDEPPATQSVEEEESVFGEDAGDNPVELALAMRKRALFRQASTASDSQAFDELSDCTESPHGTIVSVACTTPLASPPFPEDMAEDSSNGPAHPLGNSNRVQKTHGAQN
jgi:hypothetical protein